VRTHCSFLASAWSLPEPDNAVYRDVRSHRAGDTIELAAAPGVQVAEAELIPPRR